MKRLAQLLTDDTLILSPLFVLSLAVLHVGLDGVEMTVSDQILVGVGWGVGISILDDIVRNWSKK